MMTTAQTLDAPAAALGPYDNFDVSRRFNAKAYVTNKENWEDEQTRLRDGGGKPESVPR